MRRPHKLNDNRGQEYPRNMIFVDTESWQQKEKDDSITHTLRLGVAHYWRRLAPRQADVHEEIVFHTKDEFWQFVASRHLKRSRLYLIAHNWGFDFPILDTHRSLESLGYNVKNFYTKGMTTLMDYRNDSRTLKIVDNTNIFPMSLRALGGSIGSEKGIVDFAKVSEHDLISYCQQDVRVMIDAWIAWFAFLTKYDLGNFAPTLASQAFNAYRHNFKSCDIYIHANKHMIKLEREAYHGGRTEVLRRGSFTGERFYKLDVNAMYPSVMSNYTYPVRDLRFVKDSSVQYLAKLLTDHCVIAKVLVDVNEPVFPISVNGFRSYPIGTFWTTLTTEELRLGLDRDWILLVEDIAIYESAYAFTDWVSWVWGTEQEAKLNGDKVLAFQCKLLRNSLYGKFGQRDLERQLLGPAEGEGRNELITYSADSDEVITDFNALGFRWRESKGDVSFNAFPAIAAHVTANARLRLAMFIRTAGREHVYYVDTDSLIVDGKGYERLTPWVDTSRLGYLKLEGIADQINIRAPKDYTFAEDEHIKGVSRDSNKLDDNVFRQLQWPGLLQSFARGHYDKVVTVPVTKVLAREVRTGIEREGGYIEPWHLGIDDAGRMIVNDR